jgi:hypothetical protein
MEIVLFGPRWQCIVWGVLSRLEDQKFGPLRQTLCGSSAGLTIRPICNLPIFNSTFSPTYGFGCVRNLSLKQSLATIDTG